MNILELAKSIKDQINQYCEITYDDGHRRHLGASQIGHECDRHLWYKFRWTHKENFDGRMRRLFQRGHLEESRIIEYLRGIGITVISHDPDTGKQFTISDIDGHFGGSCDGIAELPPEIAVDGIPSRVLVEFKTSSTGNPFNDLSKGVKMAKPQHYAQMCVYGKYLNLTHALYIVVNKNDDDLYVEIVELDHGYANVLVNKALSIVHASDPPMKMSQHATYFKCKFCSSYGVCHMDDQVEKNCRSCKYAVPTKGKKWFCGLHQSEIPDEFIATGCDQWKGIQ